METQFKISSNIHVDFQTIHDSYCMRLTRYAADGKAVFIDLDGHEAKLLYEKLYKRLAQQNEIFVKFTKEQFEFLQECLENYNDKGPYNEGWQSDELMEIRDCLQEKENS